MMTKGLTFRTSGFVAEPAPTPLAAMGLTVLAALSFKIFLAAQLGPESYQAMIADMAHGDLAQRVAGTVLALDEISTGLAGALAPWIG